MHFIVLERHEAPVVSFHTYVNAGSVDDPKGATGLAHMFEHMAFKGTETIGTTNWPAEKKAMDEIERVYDQLDAERNKLARADPEKIKKLEAAVHDAIEKADSYVVPNLYPRIIEENGGVGMNASTGEDSTDYFYNFPPTASNCGSTSNRHASCIPFTASFTRSAMWSAKSGACAWNPIRKAS